MPTRVEITGKQRPLQVLHFFNKLWLQCRYCHYPLPSLQGMCMDGLQAPRTGCYCYGMSLDAASWDAKSMCLTTPDQTASSRMLPIMHFIPTAQPSKTQDQYDCPLYRTAERADAVSTAGYTMNFVLHMPLPIQAGTSPADWLIQGVAAICSNPRV
jgi:hypothetical protein